MSSAQDDSSWLRTPPTDSVEIASRYDDWVETYDQDLVSWGYEAPAGGARLLRDATAGGSVLDVGCGTGLTGNALNALGFGPIDGVDLSDRSIDRSRNLGIYRNLTQADFNEAPLPSADAAYDALLCVGVMSYAMEPEALLLEFARVVVPGGVFVFSHRTDLFDEQDMAALLDDLCRRGVLASVTITEPRPYMPGNADYADLVVRFVTAVTSS